MTIRQIWKSLTRNRRVKKAIRKIKADHIKEHIREQNIKNQRYLDAEFSKKYNIKVG